MGLQDFENMGYRCGGGGVPVQDGDVMGWRCDCEVLIGWLGLCGFVKCTTLRSLVDERRLGRGFVDD